MTSMSPLEATGVLFGLVSVILTVRQSIWCWPTGIVNVTLFFVMFLGARLYAAMALQVVFFVLSVYGWYRWLHPAPGQRELPVSRLSPVEGAALLVGGGLVIAGVGTCLSRRTDAVLPYWDTASTVMSVAAQWLLARKVLENWLVWIVADLVMIGVYYKQRLLLTSALYVVFTGLSAAGYLEWRKAAKA